MKKGKNCDVKEEEAEEEEEEKKRAIKGARVLVCKCENVHLCECDCVCELQTLDRPAFNQKTSYLKRSFELFSNKRQVWRFYRKQSISRWMNQLKINLGGNLFKIYWSDHKISMDTSLESIQDCTLTRNYLRLS